MWWIVLAEKHALPVGAHVFIWYLSAQGKTPEVTKERAERLNSIKTSSWRKNPRGDEGGHLLRTEFILINGVDLETKRTLLVSCFHSIWSTSASSPFSFNLLQGLVTVDLVDFYLHVLFVCFFKPKNKQKCNKTILSCLPFWLSVTSPEGALPASPWPLNFWIS